jgi:hypothetical protein
MASERNPVDKTIGRREWRETIQQYDIRTGTQQAPTKKYRRPKSSTGQSSKAKTDIFVRGRRLDGGGWAGRRQK